MGQIFPATGTVGVTDGVGVGVALGPGDAAGQIQSESVWQDGFRQ